MNESEFTFTDRDVTDVTAEHGAIGGRPDVLPAHMSTSRPLLSTLTLLRPVSGRGAAAPLEAQGHDRTVKGKSAPDDLTSVTALEPKIRVEPRSLVEPKTGFDPRSLVEPKTGVEPKTQFEPKSGVEQKTLVEAKPVVTSSHASSYSRSTPRQIFFSLPPVVNNWTPENKYKSSSVSYQRVVSTEDKEKCTDSLSFHSAAMSTQQASVSLTQVTSTTQGQHTTTSVSCRTSGLGAITLES